MPTGYPDYRRQADADSSPLFVVDNNAVHNGAVIDGPFFVGNFEATGFSLAAVDHPLVVDLLWYDDIAQTTLMGDRQFTVITGGGTVQGTFRNLGRFLFVERDPRGAGNWSSAFRLWGSNRQGGREFTPKTPVLIDQSAGGLGVGLTSTFDFGEIFSGLATVRASTGGQPGQFLLDTYLSPTVLTTFYVVNLAANSSDTREIAIPPSWCRCRMTNTGVAAATFTLAAVPAIL